MFKRFFFSAVIAASLSATLVDTAVAQQSAAAPIGTPQAQRCYMILGEQSSTPGSALVEFQAGQVQLYFLRSIKPYADMQKGLPFDAVASSMYNQGKRNVTKKDSAIVFDNGQNATYTIVVNGNALQGKIKNPKGEEFPARGACS